MFSPLSLAHSTASTLQGQAPWSTAPYSGQSFNTQLLFGTLGIVSDLFRPYISDRMSVQLVRGQNECICNNLTLEKNSKYSNFKEVQLSGVSPCFPGFSPLHSHFCLNSICNSDVKRIPHTRKSNFNYQLQTFA